MSQPGDQARVTVGYDRLDEAVAGNRAAGAHLWVILCNYGLTDAEAAHASEGITQILDPAHLLAVTDIGCFICELPYREAVRDARCKGEPVSYLPNGAPVYRDGSEGTGQLTPRT